MKYRQPVTQHHILPASWGGNSSPNNIIGLKENIHRAVHTVFDNDTPIQRIRRLLETDKRVMMPSVYLAISNTLKRFEGVIEISSYEESCVNIDKFYKRLNHA